jgi:transposase-like protein
MSLQDHVAAARTRAHGRMTLSDLPPADTKRWVASRKAAVVAAVRQGLLTEEEACKRYGLSREEFEGWRAALDEHGVGALRATRIQLYRS